VKTLVTMYHGTHELFRPVTYEPMLEFAQRHGYRLVEAEIEDHKAHPVWAKISTLRHELERNDWVTWLDCDCLVVDQTLDPIHALLPNEFLAILDDMRSGICAALFVVRCGPWARAFLDEVWSYRYHDSLEPPATVDFPDWEQGAMRHVLREPRFGRGVAMLDYHWAGPMGEGSDPTARLMHGGRQTAETVPDRVRSLQERYAERMAHA